MVNHKERDMDRKGFTLGLMALLLSLQPQANAAAKRTNADGCALLASTVESAVLRAAGQSGIRPSWRLNGDRPFNDGIATQGPASCDQTTRVTTAAFSAALSKIGMPVGWGYTPPDSGDYCFSHYLDQCYPRLVSGYSASSAKQLSFVNDAWKAVNTGVRNFMPFGAAGNFSSFSPGVLNLSVIGAVASNVDAFSNPAAGPPLKRLEHH